METKRTIWHVLICVGLVGLIWGGYILAMIPIKRMNEMKPVLKQNTTIDYAILKDVEEVRLEDEWVVLSGWVLRLNSKNQEVRLILEPVDGSEPRVMEMEYTERKDVGNYFSPNWDFGECGFVASEKKSKIEEDCCYELFVALSYEESDGTQMVKKTKRVTTNQFLYNWELYDYNTETFEKPKITDEELLKVIEEGSVRQYSPEQRFWIYQYNGELYYFLDTTTGLILGDNIGIPVMPYTSRKELLPEDKPENDYLGFLYEDERYGRDRVGEYQVARVALSTKYPIIYIATGLYDNVAKTWVKDLYIDVDWNKLLNGQE